MAALRPVHYQELVRVFERDGFHFNRQEGDHVIYVKSGVKRPIVIPMYRAVPVFIIKTSCGPHRPKVCCASRIDQPEAALRVFNGEWLRKTAPDQLTLIGDSLLGQK